MNDLFKQIGSAKIECLHRGMVTRPTVDELYQSFKERLIDETCSREKRSQCEEITNKMQRGSK